MDNRHGWHEERRGYSTPCHIFEGPRSPEGYGVAVLDGGPYPAHKLAYERVHGKLPAGVHLHHRCRQRDCVRLDHLLRLDRAQHTAMHNRERSARRYCRRGHRFTPENTYIMPNGKRNCRTCRAIAARKRRKESAHE